jgi:hypothetical protein
MSLPVMQKVEGTRTIRRSKGGIKGRDIYCPLTTFTEDKLLLGDHGAMLRVRAVWYNNR